MKAKGTPYSWLFFAGNGDAVLMSSLVGLSIARCCSIVTPRQSSDLCGTTSHPDHHRAIRSWHVGRILVLSARSAACLAVPRVRLQCHAALGVVWRHSSGRARTGLLPQQSGYRCSFALETLASA